MRVPKCIKLNNTMCLVGGGTSMRRREQSTESSTICIGNGEAINNQQNHRPYP